MRLDLGSGDSYVGGYTSVDLYAPADVTAPLWDLPFGDGTVESIRCHHALEHVRFDQTLPTLREWHRVLRPGGTVELEVPDLDAICREFIDGFGEDRVTAYRAIYGSQEREGQTHLQGFTFERLRLTLIGAGFEEPIIKRVTTYGSGCLYAETVRP